ncbi:MAG: hypothetical protein ACLFSQ_11165 [Candidatus Zixiibacteriota bacterium]
MLVFTILLTVKLLSRMIFYSNEAISIFELSAMIIIDIISVLLFGFAYAVILLALLTFFWNLLFYLSIQIVCPRRLRVVSVFVFILIYLVFSMSDFSGSFNGSYYLAFFRFLYSSEILAEVLFSKLHQNLFILIGFIFCISESSWIIGYFLRQVKAGFDSDMLTSTNLGRLIGILERILIYAFTLMANPVAIGFVISAKGIARFSKLDSQIFAEYFLVGTLLSVISAGLIGLIIRAYIF